MKRFFNFHKRGTHFGQWTVIRPMSRGASGQAYLVRKTGTDGPELVLKLWHGDFITATREDFRHECEMLALLPKDSRVLPLVDTGETEDRRPFHVTERLSPLKTPQTFDETKLLLIGMAYALVPVHEAGILHRDVTDAHFGLRNGVVNLIDFGCAEQAWKSGDDGLAVGSDGFVAPEVLSRLEYSVQSDIFMLVTAMRKVCPARYYASFKHVFKRGTHHKLERRYHTVDELISDLRAAKFRRIRHPRLVLAALAVTGLTALAAVSLTYHKFDSTVESARSQFKPQLASSITASTGIACYKRGDYKRAFLLLSEAAKDPDLKNGEALGLLAECYFYHLNGEQDLDKSKEAAARAAHVGDARGKAILQKIANVSELH